MMLTRSNCGMLCEQCSLDDCPQPFGSIAMQCNFPEASVDMLVLLIGLLYMLCEECESELNSYELILPALMCGRKLIGFNGHSL